MNNNENKLTIKEIKEQLKEKGLSLKGTKNILLERLQKYQRKEEEKKRKEENKQQEEQEQEQEQEDEQEEEGKEEEEEDFSNLDFDEIKNQLNLKNISKIQKMLKKRDLSVNGKKEVLITRLATRLEKEKDPFFVARPKKKVKTCEWCGSNMIKRNGRKGEFYGCSSYPNCQYTTSLSGYAKPSREALRGLPADDNNQVIGWNRLEWARLRYDQAERREREQDKRDEKLYGNL